MNAQINNYIDGNLNDLVNTLSTLISIPSVRGEAEDNAPYGKSCADALKKTADIAKSFGFTVSTFENRVCTVDFYPEGEPALGILCHLDVVPAGDGWKTPAFVPIVSGGKISGRGASDDKGPAVCALYALKAIKDLNIKLSKNVRLIFGTDEECGSSDLALYKAKNKIPPMVFTPDASYPVINIEKGMIRGVFFADCLSEGEKTVISAQAGTVINAVPSGASAVVKGFTPAELKTAVYSVKTSAVFSFKADDDKTEITVEGKSAHASTPETGVNAAVALCLMLSKLKTSDGTSALFGRISSLFPSGENDGKALGIKASDEKSGALTAVFSILSFADGKLSGKFDIRFPVCLSVPVLTEKLNRAFSEKELSLTVSGTEPHEVDSGSDFIKTLLSVYEECTGARGSCIAIGGGTYVHEIEGGVAFGAEFIGDDNHIHSANEFITLERLKTNAKIFAEAIIRLCK